MVVGGLVNRAVLHFRRNMRFVCRSHVRNPPELLPTLSYDRRGARRRYSNFGRRSDSEWCYRASAAANRRTMQGELLGQEPVKRLESDVKSALRRRPSHEAKLAGALRALAPYSPTLRELLGEILDVLVRRGSFDRPLYGAAVRSFAELSNGEATQPLAKALGADDCGGLATLSAACFSKDADLGAPLARVAMCRQPHLAFAAEVARLARGEGNGAHITSLAPKIKESHRISLCVELLVPLLRREPLPVAIAPGLSVLRGSERHLGRWLVFGEIAARAGDDEPYREAKERSLDGPSSARAAWGFVAWALSSHEAPAPRQRPTVELVARLSDRPSADRDTTFLYRLASAGAEGARPMLETLVRGTSLGEVVAIRAALHLARDYGRNDLRSMLGDIAGSARREPLRGVAAAALYDAGGAEKPLDLADQLVKSRQLSTVAWGGLLRVAAQGGLDGAVVSEPAFRRVQLGWIE